MSTDTNAQERDIRAAYDAARSRMNAPWKHLDGQFASLSNALAQSRRRECGHNSATDHAARAYEQRLLDDALAEFSRWRDMDEAQLQGEAAIVTWRAEQAFAQQHAHPLLEAS